MKKFVKDNIAIVAAIALPLVLIVVLGCRLFLSTQRFPTRNMISLS